MPTAIEISQALKHALLDLKQFRFWVLPGLKLGDQDSVYLAFANVPPKNSGGRKDIDFLNARKKITIHINAAPAYHWPSGGEAPAKSHNQIMKSIANFFIENGPY